VLPTQRLSRNNHRCAVHRAPWVGCKHHFARLSSIEGTFMKSSKRKISLAVALVFSALTASASMAQTPPSLT
jgi:hypothetical protein